MTSDFWYWDFNSQILTLELGKQENLRSIEYLYFYMLCSNLYFYQSMWAVLGFQILFCLAPSPSQISIFFVGKEYNVNLPDTTWIQFVIFFFIKNFSEQVSLIFHRFISLILMFQEKFAFKNQKFCVVGNSWQWWIHVCWFKIFYHSKLGMLPLLKLFFNVIVYVVVEAIFILP